ncbi:MAG: RcnB family protein [Alphaproteobacteria bacterium]|nr:RcnB family protein [Alphaproteobacteria bacterium]
MYLPYLFWTRNYWIDNYWTFGLPQPPYGYAWVREGNDALLINEQDGYILQVVYGVFY